MMARVSLFEYNGYWYSIGDDDGNFTYIVLKLHKERKVQELTGKEVNMTHIVAQRKVRTNKGKKAIKRAIMQDKYDTFRKLQ